jgi:hypothetical protein
VKKFWLGLTIFFLGCSDLLIKDQGSEISLDEQASFFKEPEMVSYKLITTREGEEITTSASLTLGLVCDNVYGTNATGDWSQNNVSVTLTSGAGTVQLPQSKACRITLTNYYDGTNTYTAVLTSLVVTVSTAGAIAVQAPGTAQEYIGGGIKDWFFAASAGTYSIVYNFAADSITATQTITPTVISIQTVNLAIAGITPPTVTGLTLYSLGPINSQAAVGYTLVATVTGSTSCKLIDNSSSTYTATSWSSVNTAYNAATITCPSFVPGVAGNQNNWTSYYNGTTQKTLTIWANTVNGLNAYTTANF